MAQGKTAGIAITSLVLGILGLTCLGPLGAIPAIICGHIGWSKIRKSEGMLQGEGLALAGLITGYVSLAIAIVLIPLYAAIAVPSFMRARTTSQANACINNLRQIEAAKDMYALEHGLTNLSVVTWSDIGPSNTSGFLKAWPLCPGSSTTDPNEAATEADYVINPVGVNAACKHFYNATPAHRLPSENGE